MTWSIVLTVRICRVKTSSCGDIYFYIFSKYWNWSSYTGTIDTVYMNKHEVDEVHFGTSTLLEQLIAETTMKL